MQVHTEVQRGLQEALSRAAPRVKESLRQAESRLDPADAQVLRTTADRLDEVFDRLSQRLGEVLRDGGALDVDQIVNSVMGRVAPAAGDALNAAGIKAGQVDDIVSKAIQQALAQTSANGGVPIPADKLGHIVSDAIEKGVGAARSSLAGAV